MIFDNRMRALKYRMKHVGNEIHPYVKYHDHPRGRLDERQMPQLGGEEHEPALS